MNEDELKSATLLKLALNPPLIHATLFGHRHPNVTPDFHQQIIKKLHGPSRNYLAMAFRGAAKSTIVEEAIVVKACLKKFKNCLIIGENYERACDRLRSIKREFETNLLLEGLFGPLMGPVWHESKIELSTGVVIQCAGQGQAVRGTKHIDVRPDFLFVDDLESKENTATKEARRKLSIWVAGDLFPALDPGAQRRVAATPLDPEAWAVRLCQDPDWEYDIFPIEYVDEQGERRATWPDRFPLGWIDREKQEKTRAGRTVEWIQEYMCEAVDPSTRVFTQDMFRFEPSLRHTWEPVYVAYDPARTAKASSATTGYVCASWVGRRLVIWEAGGKRWKPSEVIEDLFRVESRYSPTVIGVEKDGLEEFLMQPIRQEQLRRSMLLPVRALKAPKGKLDFIQRLQPLFEAGDIVFAGNAEAFVETTSQFIGYPSGDIDIPNAFAYLLEMRNGIPVYEDAHEKHIAEELAIRPGPITLAINSSAFGSAAILFQYTKQVLTILQSWVANEDAGQALPSIIEEARLYASRSITVVAPPVHFEPRGVLGLRAALRGVSEIRRGGDNLKGREVLRNLLRSETQGCPRLLLGPDATWARRAILGGYAREIGATEPKPSLYATLVEGLESAMAGVAHVSQDTQAYATTPDGRRYATAEVQRPL